MAIVYFDKGPHAELFKEEEGSIDLAENDLFFSEPPQ
jgi:hypothetical protein